MVHEMGTVALKREEKKRKRERESYKYNMHQTLKYFNTLTCSAEVTAQNAISRNPCS